MACKLTTNQPGALAPGNKGDRQMSKLTHLFARHQATMRSAETPEAIQERKEYAIASDLARNDVAAAFPVLTKGNLEAAAEYQKERLAYHRLAVSHRLRGLA